MNKRLFLILSAFLLLFSLIEKGWTIETYRPETSVAGFIQLPGSGRQVYNFNPGWRFFKGDICGAESVDFDDCSWTIDRSGKRLHRSQRLRPFLERGKLLERGVEQRH